MDPHDPGHTRPADAWTAGEVSVGVISGLLDVLRDRSEDFLVEAGVEQVHKLRVAVRRLRALAAFVEPVFDPHLRRARRGLRGPGRELGALRDVDVLLGRLDGGSVLLPAHDLGRTRHALALRRAELTRSALSVVASRSWEHRLGDVHEAIAHDHMDRAEASLPAGSAMAARLQEWWGDLEPEWEGLAGMSPPRRHRVRIRTKRLRYALEAVGEHLPMTDGALRERLGDLEDLQDTLGALNDRRVAPGLLSSVGIEVPGGPPEDTGTEDTRGESADDDELAHALAACTRLLAHGPVWSDGSTGTTRTTGPAGSTGTGEP